MAGGLQNVARNAYDKVLSSPLAAKLNRVVGPAGDFLNSARSVNWDPFALSQGAYELDNAAGGPAQNVLRQYDENQSHELPVAPAPGLDVAQRLAAQNNDAPTLASTLGMRSGLSSVKR